MQHVIVGAGPAGLTAAETLRSLDRDAAICLIGGESEPPYSRMAIPYLLMDQITEAGTYLRQDDAHLERLGIELRHAWVSGIDAGQRQLQLSGGERLGYDRLLLATGSSPLQPPITGLDLPGVHSCWTLPDARQILARARPGSRVALIGAGFIGSIILEALATRGVSLTVIEQGERMVPRMMSAAAGTLLRRWCEKKGVVVHVGARVAGLTQGTGGSLTVALADTTPVEADLVITATGVRPNLDFLADSGVRVEQGVVVDRHLRSSVPEIFAAGDAAQGLDFSTGGFSVHAIQPTASDHGYVAALNMAGRSAPYEGSINMNVLDTLGLISCSFGLWMGVEGGEEAALSQPEDFRHLSLQFADDRLVGAHAVGMTQHIGVLRGLIQRRTRLGPWKARLMRDPTRFNEAYLATSQVL